jgi:hypothetical protein
MAAFATMAAAEARVVAKVKDHTWINGHSCRLMDGTIAVRVQRYMSPTNPAYGAWVEITDDATD